MVTIITLLLEMLLLSVLNMLSADPYVSDFLVHILILVLSLALFIDISKSRTFRGIRAIVFLGYLLRIVILMLDSYVPNARIIGSGADSERFFRRMTWMVTMEGYVSNFLYVAIWGYLFRFIGISRLFAQYCNVLLSMVTVYFTVRSMRLLGVETNSLKRSAFLISVLPVTLCMSVILLRESVVCMWITIAVYLCLKWMKQGGERNYFGALAATFIATAFHSGSIGVAAGIVFVRMFYDRKRSNMHMKSSTIFVGALALFVFAFLFLNFSDTIFYKFSSVESLEEIGEGDSGNSSYAAYVGDSRSIPRFIIFSIPRMFFFLFSPVPWMWRGFFDIIAFVFSSAYYLYVLISAFKSLRRRNENYPYKSYMIAILITVLITTFIFAWGTINAGTAIRHREKMVSCFAILLSMTKSRINFSSRSAIT